MAEVQVVSLAPSDRDWARGGARISPTMALHTSLLLLTVCNLGRIPVFDLGDREAPVLVNDLAVAFVVTIGMLSMLAARTFRLDRVAFAALAFAAVGGLSALAAGPRFALTPFEIAASLAYLARWLLYFGVYLVVINCVRERNVVGLWRSLEWAMLVFAAFGVVQSIFLPDFARMIYPDQPAAWDAQRHRLVSTVLDPNVAAAMILLVLLGHLAQLSSGVKVAVWKPALLLVSLVLTLSRSGMLGLAVGGLVVLYARGLSKRVLRFGALAIVAAVALLPRIIAFGAQYERFTLSDGSAAARLVAWGRALEAFLDNPWIGIGFNTYGFVQEHRGFARVGSGASYSAEGGLLFVAVMTGVVGLTAFVVMLWLVLRQCQAGWRDLATRPEARALYVGTAAATVAIVAHSVFVNSLLVPFVMQPLWILWGLVYVSRSRFRQQTAGGA